MVIEHETLNEKEAILWAQKGNWFYFSPCLITLILSRVVYNYWPEPIVFIIPSFILIYSVSMLSVTYFILTNQNLRGCNGLFKRNTFCIPLESILSITIRANTLEDFLNFASIEIVTQTKVYNVKHISKANTFKQDVMQQYDNFINQ